MWLAPIVPWALVGFQGSCLAPTGASALGHIIESWLTPWPPSWSTPWPNPSPTSCPAQLWPTVSQIHLCKFCILCIKWCYTICPLLDQIFAPHSRFMRWCTLICILPRAVWPLIIIITLYLSQGWISAIIFFLECLFVHYMYVAGIEGLRYTYIGESFNVNDHIPFLIFLYLLRQQNKT